MNQKLRQLMEERQRYLDKQEAHYNRFTDEELGSDNFKKYEEEPRCEELRIEIQNLIEKEHRNLTLENIFEGLTSIGACPSLLYDDNGNFAIGTTGFQNVNLEETEEANFEGSWILQKKDWKPTIREALEVFFNDNN